jgi:hypothetical protein
MYTKWENYFFSELLALYITGQRFPDCASRRPVEAWNYVCGGDKKLKIVSTKNKHRKGYEFYCIQNVAKFRCIMSSQLRRTRVPLIDQVQLLFF